jgi:hypothetical protein
MFFNRKIVKVDANVWGGIANRLFKLGLKEIPDPETVSWSSIKPEQLANLYFEEYVGFHRTACFHSKRAMLVLVRNDGAQRWFDCCPESLTALKYRCKG